MHVVITTALPQADTPEAPLNGCLDLAKAVHMLGHEVTVVAPLFASVDPTAQALARRLSKIEFACENEELACALYEGRTPAGVRLSYLGHDTLFGSVTSFSEGGDRALALKRATAFAQACNAFVERLDPQVNVVHGYGWAGGLCGLARGENAGSAPPFVFTVPGSDSDDGSFAAALASQVSFLGAATAGDVTSMSQLACGAAHACTVTGTAPSWMATADADKGEPLQILPGVDPSVWNPATDAALASRFDPTNLEGKAVCKSTLQRDLGLPVVPEIPLFVLFTGDTDANAFVEIAEDILRLDVQVLCAHSSPPDALTSLQERFDDRFRIAPLDATRDRQLLAAADLSLDCANLPVRAMQAQRYGALPLVPRDPVLAHVVSDCDPQLTSGSGFVFDSAEDGDLLATVRRAVSTAYQADFPKLQGRAMQIDHSWERTARRYELLYRNACDPSN